MANKVRWKWLRRGIVVHGIFFALSSSVALAGDVVSVNRILSNPDGYQLKGVELQGTARNVKKLPIDHKLLGAPGLCMAAFLMDSYTFMLEDETGTLEVFVSGGCKPRLSTPVSDGDVVSVQGLLNAFYQDDPLHKSVRLEARDILVLTEAEPTREK